MKKYFCFLVLIIFISCSTVPKNVSVVETKKEEEILKEQIDKEKESLEKKEQVKISDMSYKVKKGDTLTKIAKEYYGSVKFWKKIADDNNLKEPYLLKENAKLIIKKSVDLKVKKEFTYPMYKNKAFGVGEKLVFAVKYFNITAGFGILEVKDIVEINGRKAYHLEATARTSPFFETFYRVRDIITSYMDIKGLFSWKYSKHLEEGSYRHDSYMEFFHKEGYAQKSDGKRCDIPAFVQDVLSEFYYFRAMYKGEDEFYINVASDECKVYQILVKKLRYEKVTVDAGEFDCVVIQPFLKYEGIFRQKGDVWIWLTNDENLMPVLVKSQIVIGTIDAVLQSATVVR
ncbi:MAG: DUF3108 domain-containing protein [Candidatus Goldbacteria bacterium]|nr:DUF3108 domain-containing protein [Candidatus Goldiibacteriota bacterium]